MNFDFLAQGDSRYNSIANCRFVRVHHSQQLIDNTRLLEATKNIVLFYFIFISQST